VNSSAGQVGIALAQATALLMSVAFIAYALIIAVPFVRYRARRPGDARTLAWHLFVPALNEERVIGETVGYLRATFPDAHVWVIDDDSDDRTAPIVYAHAEADPMVHLVPRRHPDARTGKGDALNAAYQELGDWLQASADRSRTIIGVIDADGRPAPNCLDVCAGASLFGDAAVGSVQILVRMLNRDDRRPFPHRSRLVNALGHILLRLQDLEFRVPISAIQITRRVTRSVGLGGNGQFTRLSALDAVADENARPWRGALLDDYELSLHLMLTGHRNEYTQDTHVDQEALPDIRRLAADPVGPGHDAVRRVPAQAVDVPACVHDRRPGGHVLPDPAVAPAGRDVRLSRARHCVPRQLRGRAGRDAGVDRTGRVDDPAVLPRRGARPVRAVGPHVRQALRTATRVSAGDLPRRRVLAVRPHFLHNVVAGVLPDPAAPQ
jgi:hypothetical protein